MKHSTTWCALALIALAPMAGGAFAGAVKGSKSNSSEYSFAATDTVAASDCTAKGGTVAVGTGGNQTCTLPAGSTSLTFAATDTVAATHCTSTGGVVTPGTDGQSLCTKAGTAAPSPTTSSSSSTTTREPHN